MNQKIVVKREKDLLTRVWLTTERQFAGYLRIDLCSCIRPRDVLSLYPSLQWKPNKTLRVMFPLLVRKCRYRKHSNGNFLVWFHCLDDFLSFSQVIILFYY